MIAKLFAKYQSIGLITLSLLAGAIMTFIALPVLTRLYSVADFGAYGIALALVSVLSTIANLRLDQALLVAEEQDKKSLIFEGSVFSTVIAVVSGIVISFILNIEMAGAVATGILANTLIQSLYNYHFSAHQEYFCAGLNIFRSAIVVAVQLSLPLVMQISLVNSYNVSSIIMIVAVLIYLLKHQLYQVSWQVFKHYKDFIYANTPHALLNSFSHNLPYYVVSHFVGVQAMGFYAIVERTLRVPINLISQTLRQFFIRKFKNTESNQNVLKASVLLSLVSLPLFAIFFILPESLYLWVFGSEWVGISSYFQILALGYWAIFCNPPSSAFLIAKRNSQVLFKLQIVELIIKFALFAGFYAVFADKVYMLLAVPVALIFYNFAILYVVWRKKLMFFKVLKYMNWFASQCRKVMYNMAFGTKFRYFGKGCTVDIRGKMQIGNNVYIGDHVSLIVENGAVLEIADNSFIGENCYIKCFGGKVSIGKDVSINSKSYINGCGGVTIGDNTRIGTQSIIIASNHKFGEPDLLVKDAITKQGVSLGKNIWLGARVTVLDGVTIADDSVIGACSLVSKPLPESGVYVGIPAKKIKSV